jgi:hypothetical protein
MEKTEEKFKPLFINQVLKDIKFYNTKENYLSLEPEQKWVIQGGVEFIFEEAIISLGWSEEMQLYEMIEGDLDHLLGEMDVYEIELDMHEEIQNIKNQPIKNISFNWSWYQKMNDEMELTDEKVYIPQEILMTFENDDVLQIATVLFQLRGKQLHNAIFDPQGNMLITLNEKVEIEGS